MISRSIMTPTPHINIKLDNTVLERVQKTRFLGITLHSSLKWKSHIDYLKEKISKITGIIYKIREKIDNCTMKHI